MKHNAFLSLVVGVAAALALVGCGSAEPEAAPPSDAPKTSDLGSTDGSGAAPATAPSTMGGPSND